MSDDLAAILAGIRERNERVRIKYGYVGGLLALAGAKDDVPRLLAAVEAALKLAGDWDAPVTPESSELLDRQDCAQAVREAITAALAGEEAGDG